MVQTLTKVSQQKVLDFIQQLRKGWEAANTYGLNTFTLFAYYWDEKALREAFEQIKADPAFDGLFFKWNGAATEIKSVSLSISCEEIPDKPCHLKKPEFLFSKSPKSKAKSKKFKDLLFTSKSKKGGGKPA